MRKRRDIKYDGGTTRNAVMAMAAVLLLALSLLAEDSETVLYTFPGGSHGAYGATQLVADSSGNLYGSTLSGGNNSTSCETATGVPGCGVVYKLTPRAQGTWDETVLYTFTGAGDGSLPFAGVIRDSSGNLYGTATFYGVVCCGVVFKLTPTDKGPWTESVLYSFTGGTDGNAPYGGLTFDPRGNLYGVTLYGGDLSVKCFGATGCGVVFKLAPTRSGPWTETVLHAFTDGPDGAYSLLGVILDSRGNVYGTTFYGGNTTANHCLGGYGIDVPPGCGV